MGRGSRELAAVLKAMGSLEEAKRQAAVARRLLTKAGATLELKRLDALGL